MIEKEIKNAIIIFTRYPEPGKVKTRLADSIGENSSCLIHKILAERIFNECLLLNKNDFQAFVFYPKENSEEQIRDWIDRRFILHHQIGNTLGEKMKNAFDTVFSLGFKKIVITGTDIPDISKSLLSKCFLELEKNDLVIGPSNDGGYYLLGMNKFTHEVFDNIKWSTDSVFQKTIEIINENNLSFTTIEKLIDIDVKEDLLTWYETNKQNHKDELVKFISELKL